MTICVDSKGHSDCLVAGTTLAVCGKSLHSTLDTGSSAKGLPWCVAHPWFCNTVQQANNYLSTLKTM